MIFKPETEAAVIDSNVNMIPKTCSIVVLCPRGSITREWLAGTRLFRLINTSRFNNGQLQLRIAGADLRYPEVGIRNRNDILRISLLNPTATTSSISPFTDSQALLNFDQLRKMCFDIYHFVSKCQWQLRCSLARQVTSIVTAYLLESGINYTVISVSDFIHIRIGHDMVYR